jgi:hypothetical protein
MEILTRIEAIISWYKDNAATQSIDALLSERDSLAVYSYSLAELSGASKGDYNEAYFIRKVYVTRKTQQLIAKGLAYNKAEAESLLANEAVYKDEILKESISYKYDLLLKQVNKILDAMSQRISYLKQEEVMARQQKIT